MNGQIVKGVAKAAPYVLKAGRVVGSTTAAIATSSTFPLTVGVVGVCAVGIYAIHKNKKVKAFFGKNGDDWGFGFSAE